MDRARHVAIAAAAAVCLLRLCAVASGEQCVMPPSGEIAAQCSRTRTLSGGMTGTRWAYNWRTRRCHRVALSCDDTVWTLFDTKRQCMDACRHSAAGSDHRPGWNPPAAVHTTTQRATPAPTTTLPHRICDTFVDLVILLDSSGSIEEGPGCAGCFASVVRKFATEIIKRRDRCSASGGADDYKAMQFAVWRFGNDFEQCDAPDSYDINKAENGYGSYDPYDGFGFEDAEDLDNNAIVDKVKKIKWNNAWTYIDKGFMCAKQSLDASKRRGNAAVKKIVVLITDGRTPKPIWASAKAKALREAGISVVAVGFGHGVGKDALVGYTGGRSELVFDLQEHYPLQYLNDIVSRIQICYHCLKDYYPRVATCDHQLCVDRYG